MRLKCFLQSFKYSPIGVICNMVKLILRFIAISFLLLLFSCDPPSTSSLPLCAIEKCYYSIDDGDMIKIPYNSDEIETDSFDNKKFYFLIQIPIEFLPNNNEFKLDAYNDILNDYSEKYEINVIKGKIKDINGCKYLYSEIGANLDLAIMEFTLLDKYNPDFPSGVDNNSLRLSISTDSTSNIPRMEWGFLLYAKSI